MRTKRSLVQIYLLSLVALSAIPLSIFGYIWIAKEYDGFHTQSEALRTTYIESRRELLRREVDKAVEYLDFKRSQLNRQLYQDLRQQVAVGLALIENTRKEFKTESKDQQLARLRSTMSTLKFLGNKGFFFLFDEAGKPLLAPMHPWESRRITDEQALNSFVSQIVGAIGDKRYDFVEYRFSQAGSGFQNERNFSFVYHYKPLNIYMGASVYLHDEMDRVKQEVIERIAAVPIDPNNSILFIVDADGKQLVNAYDPEQVGSLMPGVIDASRKVSGKDNSLFTELSWSAGDAGNKPVVSYLRRYEPWGWVLGSGVFLDELNVRLETQRADLQERVNEHIRFIVIIAFLLMVLSTVAARLMARSSARGFDIFQKFFADASKRSTAIDISRLPFAEFQHLAEDANFMVEKRSQTERALKLSERRFSLALDAAQNHLWDLDLQTGYVTVAPSFFRMLGYEVPAQNYAVGAFKHVAHPDDIHIIASAVDSWLGLATGNSVEFRVRNRAGEYHWIYSRGDVVESDAQDQPVRAMGIMTDITERKRMEQELVDAKIAAEDALHAKSQFLSSVSHELRTPLNGVLGYAQLLQRENDLPSGSEEYLRAIENCGKHLLNLINDVLDLAKIESGNINIVRRPNNIDDVVTSVGDIVGQRAKSKGLDFVLDVAADVPRNVEIDEVKLRQILVNLLDNAVKFTRQGKVELKLRADPAQQQLLFSVTDSGIGIPEDKLRDVFEPFRQVNPRDGQGTGLGLSICRRLVEAMGGSLNLRSEYGRGSTFFFDIPLIEVTSSLEDMAAERKTEKSSPAAPEAQFDNPAIIVADDVAVNRQVLIGMLSDISSDIREAANGLEVVAQVKERAPELILMDLRMPEMDGLEATRIIKKKMACDDVQVVMASATTDEAMMKEATEAGCYGFLPKPIGMDALMAILAETCARPEQRAVAPVVPFPSGNAVALPPDSVSTSLQQAIDLGDISALGEQLQALRASHPELNAFVEQAERCLRNFDFDGISQLLSELAQGAPSDDR
ncbi:cache domain-containing protein [Spongiibacter taiwanensis]|uniref:cache domain-containing protein n=1 Tax=Spongiibacter taiwanensis TaxID=1748242 RepID=UPI002035E9FA|nr:cache domain-containing protein [Spongiibacter taiwanensis]USA42275.1 cache domain-containing protein [Spongiibacter taiwanensis]